MKQGERIITKKKTKLQDPSCFFYLWYLLASFSAELSSTQLLWLYLTYFSLSPLRFVFSFSLGIPTLRIYGMCIWFENATQT